jgi:precorrin-6x reductase
VSDPVQHRRDICDLMPVGQRWTIDHQDRQSERAGDEALLRAHAIDLVVCKNAGGTGAQAKLVAARALALPVLMIDRPALPDRHQVADIAAVLHWIAHDTDRGV